MINNVSKSIIQKFQCNKFIETGVFMGDTMMIVQDWFCELYGSEFNAGPWQQGKKGNYQMYEIECNKTYFDQFIVPRWQNQINVECINSDSVEWLKNAINKEIKNDDNCFFYLDAHSHNSPNPEPMAEEIIQIKRLYNPNGGQIISIDDWAVPHGNPDIYHTGMIRYLVKDRTDCVYYSQYSNFHGKHSVFLFLDRYSIELEEALKNLPLVKEML